MTSLVAYTILMSYPSRLCVLVPILRMAINHSSLHLYMQDVCSFTWGSQYYLTSCFSLHLHRQYVLPLLSDDVTLMIGCRRCVSGVICLAAYQTRLLYSGSRLWVSYTTLHIGKWQFHIQGVSRKHANHVIYLYTLITPVSESKFWHFQVNSKLMISFPYRWCVVCFDQMIETYHLCWNLQNVSAAKQEATLATGF
jgi:hypothetical protein